MSIQKYQKYFKDVSTLDYVDTYELNRLFPVNDDTGCILHARKKLLLPSVRTGGKTLYQEVKEARDTLNRWLEINKSETDNNRNNKQGSVQKEYKDDTELD